jgi:hypothetical protein
MAHGKTIPTAQALDIANSFLGLMRERAKCVTNAETGERVAEFEWPNMQDDLRAAEPHAHIVLYWLRATGHIITVRRARPAGPRGTTPALYRVSIGRRFTENDLRLGRLVHAKEQARRQTKLKKNGAPAAQPSPPTPPDPAPQPAPDRALRRRVQFVAPPDLRAGAVRAVHVTELDDGEGTLRVEVLTPAQHGGAAKAAVARTTEAARHYAALAPGGELDAAALLGAAGDVVNDLRRRVLELERRLDERAGEPSREDVRTEVRTLLREILGGK